MDTQKGIYASPDNVRANRDRKKELKNFFVIYTVGLDHYSKGTAVVKAYCEDDVERILKKEGVYCSLECLYHIKEISEIPELNREGVLIEDVKLTEGNGSKR